MVGSYQVSEVRLSRSSARRLLGVFVTAQPVRATACGTGRHRMPVNGWIPMDIQSVVAQLKQEASRIEQAIAAAVGLGSQPHVFGVVHPKGATLNQRGGKHRRQMSEAARARIAAAKKAWRARQKRTAAPKARLQERRESRNTSLVEGSQV
jgi:hypothetical protein